MIGGKSQHSFARFSTPNAPIGFPAAPMAAIPDGGNMQK
jgi:hypothetical protein